MLQELTGPWESNESPKGRENPWAERGLCVCVHPPLPIARLHLLKVPGHSNFFCSGNLYAKTRFSVHVCVVMCVSGCGKWPCQTMKGGEMQRVGENKAPIYSMQIQIDAPHPTSAWEGGSGCWSIPPAMAPGEFLSFTACVMLSFSCLSVKKLILTGL